MEIKKFNNKKFASDIIAKRTKDDLSTAAAGDEAGVTFMTIHRCENGNEPKLESFRAIAVWLGKSMENYFS